MCGQTHPTFAIHQEDISPHAQRTTMIHLIVQTQDSASGTQMTTLATNLTFMAIIHRAVYSVKKQIAQRSLAVHGQERHVQDKTMEFPAMKLLTRLYVMEFLYFQPVARGQTILAAYL